MRKSNYPAGGVHRLVVNSQVLRGNLLGDPIERVVDVYLPAGSDGAGLRSSPTWSGSPPVARPTPTGQHS